MADDTHGHFPAVPSVYQTLEEMDFERGLWYPALVGDMTRVRELLEKGQDPNIEDKSGYTPLHYAARCGYTSICARLLEAGARVGATTRAGQATALHRAALAGNGDIVVLLLKYGANPFAVDSDGRTALHRAVEGGHEGTVMLLLEKAPQLATIPDKTGHSPAHYAANVPAMKHLFC